MASKQQLKTPKVPVNTATAASGISLFPAAEDHDHGISATSLGVPTGSGVADRLTFWSAPTVVDDVPRTLTPGSVLFVGTDFLPQEDNANLFWDDTNDRLGIGTAVPGFGLDIQATDGDASLAITRISSNTSPSTIVGRKGRAGPGAVLANDELLSVVARGYDGAAYSTGGFLEWIATETWSGTARGNFLKFVTTADGSVTPTERFRVGQSGQWGIGGATYGGSGDIFSSGGASAAPTWVTRATLNAALDHGTLAGLTDDDHTQYALLAGRAGSANDLILSTTTQGQLAGSSASGQNLKLTSSTHATKAKILFGTSAYDEVNNRLGIGTATPGYTLNVFDGTSELRFLDGGGFPRIYLGGSSATVAGVFNRITTTADIYFGEDSDTAATNFRGHASGAVLNAIADRASNFVAGTVQNSASSATSNKARFSLFPHSGFTVALAPYIEVQNGAGANESTMAFATYADATGLTEKLRIGYDGNIAIGTTTFPSTGTKGLVFGNGTALATMAANTAGLYAADIVAGNSAIHALSEAGDLIKLYTQANTVALNDLLVNNGMRASGGNSNFTTMVDLSSLTTNPHLKVATDNTDPTGGGGAATGRIPIHDAAGNLRYLAYY